MTSKVGAWAVSVLLALSLSPLAHAQFSDTLLQGVVTAESLNIRATRSISSEVLGTLKKGEIVYVALSGDRDWYATAHKPQGGSMQLGFISSRYVRVTDILSASPSHDVHSSFGGFDNEEVLCSADSAQVSIDIVHSDFNCRKDFAGESFRSCDVTFQLSVRSDCEQPLNTHVSCDVELRYETRDGYTDRRASESGQTSIPVNYGSGFTSLEISWRPRSYLDDVVRVRMTDGSCRIAWVGDY